jgi:glutamate synthase (NADPH/NADH) small chain
MSDTCAPNFNSKFAWREFAPSGLPKRSASERVSDFLEIYGLYDEATAREQASRCIQCPNPSCVGGCPLCNPIPQWMLLTAEGRFLEAAAVLGSATNMAEICARVCPTERMCEGECILNGVSEPVAIGAIEQFLSEYALAHGHLETSTAAPNGWRVAVVGSGPGGLACADELAKQGYAVTVFDAGLVPGGLLVDGMPAFKVEKSLVQRRVEILKKRGVVFVLGVRIGEDLLLGELRSKFNAVFLGFDSRQARPLKVPGAELKGVVHALPFILQKTTSIGLEIPPLEIAGKRVVVLGGGDTAMDCVRTAIRCGASQSICVYRRDDRDMPCGRREYQNAVEEGAHFVFRAAPVAVLGSETGSVSGLRLARTEPAPGQAGESGQTGRRSFNTLPGTEFEWKADLVIPALGFDALACPHSGDFSELAVNDWGGIVVDPNQMTSVPSVFAGGDIVRGPSHVLDAVRDARKAAAQIHAFLSAKK